MFYDHWVSKSSVLGLNKRFIKKIKWILRVVSSLYYTWDYHPDPESQQETYNSGMHPVLRLRSEFVSRTLGVSAIGM